MVDSTTKTARRSLAPSSSAPELPTKPGKMRREPSVQESDLVPYESLRASNSHLIPEGFLTQEGFQIISGGGQWAGWVYLNEKEPGLFFECEVVSLAEYYVSDEKNPLRSGILVRLTAMPMDAEGNPKPVPIVVSGDAENLHEAEVGDVLCLNQSPTLDPLIAMAQDENAHVVRVVYLGKQKSRKNPQRAYHVFAMCARKTDRPRDTSLDTPFATK